MLNLLLGFIAGVLFEAFCTAISRVRRKRRAYDRAVDERDRSPQQLPHDHQTAFKAWRIPTGRGRTVHKDG